MARNHNNVGSTYHSRKREKGRNTDVIRREEKSEKRDSSSKSIIRRGGRDRTSLIVVAK